MKTRKLKGWVTKLLVVVSFLIICVLSGEFSDFGLQVVLSIVGIAIVAINAKIIAKYGTLE